MNHVIRALIIGTLSISISDAQMKRAHRYPGTQIEEVRDLAAKGDVDAVYQLAERKDRKSWPLFLNLGKSVYPSSSKQPEPLSRIRQSAPLRKQIALSLEARRGIVRQGARPDISDYVACVSDARRKDRGTCIQALGYIGSVESIKHLAPILWESGPPTTSHELTISYAEEASQALGNVRPDVQARFMLTRPGSASHLEQWKEWWETEKSKYPEKPIVIPSL